MNTQLDIFSIPPATGHDLAREGMDRAERHADQVHEGWSVMAYEYLASFIRLKPRGYSFMAEDVRRLAEQSGKVPVPPSKRAWGAVVAKACRARLIHRTGYQQVKNERAHCANASVWCVV